MDMLRLLFYAFVQDKKLIEEPPKQLELDLVLMYVRTAYQLHGLNINTLNFDLPFSVHDVRSNDLDFASRGTRRVVGKGGFGPVADVKERNRLESILEKLNAHDPIFVERMRFIYPNLRVRHKGYVQDVCMLLDAQFRSKCQEKHGENGKNGWTVGLFATNREDVYPRIGTTMSRSEIFDIAREHPRIIIIDQMKLVALKENVVENGAKKIGLEEVCVRCLSDDTLERIHGG
ncbi:regulator of telomere elongation helicase 1 [Striga asiatica]|uniref:Regulator of telomere elongation helicase 1 n=1 Tax=Striga asiatica TaxID=4170 RepID=A0A5A7Q129_STRAF|nr:regulator of telomere elongation helicase 1 [Striga asiatica]